MEKRFAQLDLLRGLAVASMLLFNWSFALLLLGVYTITDASWYWWLFPRIIAGTFILIAGISLSISHSRKRTYLHFLKRGLGILAIGMVATLATWLYLGNGFVVFGILHFIGLSIIIAPLFFRLGRWNILLGILIFASGFFLSTNSAALLWLMNYDFYTVDYFPMLPWLGLVLTGIGIGSVLNLNRKSKLRIKPIEFLGRNSLAIYVVHQPLLIIALKLFGLA